MLGTIDMAIGQCLSEEDVVIRPDRHEVGGGHGIVALTRRDGPRMDIGAFRRGAIRIAEVTVVEAVLHIAEIRPRLTLSNFHLRHIDSVIIGIIACGHLLGQCAVGLRLQVLIRGTGLQVGSLIVTLVQVEAVQVVGHLTVVEGVVRHLTGHTVRAVRRHSVSVALRIVTVLNLYETSVVAFRSGRVAEDGIDGIVHRSSTTLHPAVLDIAITRLGDTGTGERACDTEVIDLTTEVSEE